MKQLRKYWVFVLVIIMSGFCYAAPIEDAKQTIDHYYKYSAEKDVDSYIALFDQEFLDGIYGDDARELFEEVFDYFQIQDYKLDFQYYTASEESMTVFFNLKSNVIIEGEEVDMDNDMVALFTKDEGVKLRYIMLQEQFVRLMNKEFVYDAAISRVVEKDNDLKNEAEERGIELENYKDLFEQKIAEHDAKHSSRFWTWTILVLAVLFVSFYFVVRIDLVSKYIKNAKRRKHYVSFRKHFINLVDKVLIAVKTGIKKLAGFVVQASKKIHERFKRK